MSLITAPGSRENVVITIPEWLTQPALNLDEWRVKIDYSYEFPLPPTWEQWAKDFAGCLTQAISKPPRTITFQAISEGIPITLTAIQYIRLLPRTSGLENTQFIVKCSKIPDMRQEGQYRSYFTSILSGNWDDMQWVEQLKSEYPELPQSAERIRQIFLGASESVIDETTIASVAADPLTQISIEEYEFDEFHSKGACLYFRSLATI